MSFPNAINRWSWIITLALLPLLSVLPSASAQTPVQSPVPATAPVPQDTASQLSPQAAFDQATRALEITRRSPRNWSEVELAALKLARENAKSACAARNPDQLTGKDLLALAHLCAFGQLWQPVHQAAANYLDAAQRANPADATHSVEELSTAFDYKVQASLNLNDMDDAILTAQTMLRSVPYDVFASEATNTTLNYLHFIQPDKALALLAQRQPILLALIKSPTLPSPTDAPSLPPANLPPPLPIHVLYADAVAFPAMQQFANQQKEATESYSELEAALPVSLSSEDAMFIDAKRRQYLLLGTHLPVLNPYGSLLYPGAPTPDRLNSWFGFATVFLLFPDWCNQCVAMGFNSTAPAKQLLETFHVRFFPVLAQSGPPEKHADAAIKTVPLTAAKSGKGAQSSAAPAERLHVEQNLALKSTPDSLLEGTPTLVVPNETLNAFAATDFPLIVATDHNGIIRAIELAPEDALTPGGEIDQIVQHILKTWPPD